MNPTDLEIARVETFPVALPTLANFAVKRRQRRTRRRTVDPRVGEGRRRRRHVQRGEAKPIPWWTYETVESITSTIDVDKEWLGANSFAVVGND